jgi:hypothetical protein
MLDLETVAREMIRVNREDQLTNREINQAAMYFPPFIVPDCDLEEFQTLVADILWTEK